MAVKQIVVIDDQREIAEVVCDAAEMMGVKCTMAANVPELLAALTPEVGLVLMDLTMPGVSGMELIELLGERGLDAGLVLMSGVGRAAMEEARAAVAKAGVRLAGILPKPFRVAELMAVLRSGIAMDLQEAEPGVLAASD